MLSGRLAAMSFTLRIKFFEQLLNSCFALRQVFHISIDLFKRQSHNEHLTDYACRWLFNEESQVKVLVPQLFFLKDN